MSENGVAGFFRKNETWAQLLVSLFTAVAVVIYSAGSYVQATKEQSERIERYTKDQNEVMRQVSSRIDNLSDQVTRLAISNEREVEGTNDLKQRVERIERAQDGHR